MSGNVSRLNKVKQTQGEITTFHTSQKANVRQNANFKQYKATF